MATSPDSKNGHSNQSTFSLEEPLANPSPSPDFERALLILEATSPSRFLLSLHAISPNGWSGRTSPEFCRLKEDGTLVPSLEGWGVSGMGSPTGFLTLNTSDWPKDASVCSLSAVLEDSGSVPQRFYLSAKACAGILRRAENRGKELPYQLQAALTEVAATEKRKETTSSHSLPSCVEEPTPVTEQTPKPT